MRLLAAAVVAVGGVIAAARAGHDAPVPPPPPPVAAAPEHLDLIKARASRSAWRHWLHRQHTRRSAAHPYLNWDALAACESGGDWHTNTANGYYGGVQEDLTFWRSYGGLWFAARPDLASKAQQVIVAERGLAVQGWGAWPVCSRVAGLAP